MGNEDNKCFQIIDNYWNELERIGLVDSFSANVEDDSAEISATYTDKNGNLIHIEISMMVDDLAENMEM